MSVTVKQYTNLYKAFEYFNKKLFNGELPEIFITLQRKSKAAGYYSPARYVYREGKKENIPEIALNPETFVGEDDEYILSVLVHEMCHHWQQFFGDAPKRVYHDREWGGKMKEIGLQPSNTREPDGKETGASMNHYVIQGGKFEIACGAFLLDGKKLDLEAITPTKEQKERKKTREKFVCQSCMQSVQAKKTANIMCGDCRETMVIEEGD